MTRVLGVEFGPTTTQVEVRDADTGALVATGRARHDDLGPDVDDPTAWWRSLASAVRHTGEREIAAISVCGDHPGLVLLDGAGAVLRPMQPWADAEAAVHATLLRGTLGADRWAKRTGALPGPATAVTRLAWLRRTDPDTFGRIGAALLPHDWLTYRLAGRVVTDRGGASLTGAWSPASESWLAEVLEDLAPRGAPGWWDDRLPTVLGPSERSDWLDAPVYELLGLRGRPLVGPGTGQAMAVALALGLGPGRAGVSFGTTTTVLAGLAHPVADASGVVRSHADATGEHLAVATAGSGTDLLDVLRTLLDVDFGELEALAKGATAAAGGLVLIPEVPGRPGSILTGMGGGVTRADLARAGFDGVACAALDALDRMLAVGCTWDDDEPLRLASRIDAVEVLAQLLADLSGRAVRPTVGPSLGAAGACIQAAAVLFGEAPEAISSTWDLGSAEWIEPTEDPAGAAHRQAHSAERARQQRALTVQG